MTYDVEKAAAWLARQIKAGFSPTVAAKIALRAAYNAGEWALLKQQADDRAQIGLETKRQAP